MDAGVALTRLAFLVKEVHVKTDMNYLPAGKTVQ